MSLLESTKFDLFSPLILYPVLVLFFLLISINEITIFSFSLFVIFLLFFILGFLSIKRGKKREHRWIWKIGLHLIIIGIVAEVLNLYFAGGIPLLKPELREKFFSPLTYLSFLIVPGTIILFGKNFTHDKITAFAWFLAGLFLISIIGYKTEIFALILGTIFMSYYLNQDKKIKKFFTFLFLSIILLSSIILVKIQSSFLLRIPSTFSVFSMITSNLGFSFFGFTNGVLTQSIFTSPFPIQAVGPRGYMSQLIGMREGVTTTSTILGIPYIDFGVTGVIVMGYILGLIFGRGYHCLKIGNKDLLPIYVLCLSFLLLTIETGIGDIIVIAYFLIYALMII